MPIQSNPFNGNAYESRPRINLPPVNVSLYSIAVYPFLFSNLAAFSSLNAQLANPSRKANVLAVAVDTPDAAAAAVCQVAFPLTSEVRTLAAAAPDGIVNDVEYNVENCLSQTKEETWNVTGGYVYPLFCTMLCIYACMLSVSMPARRIRYLLRRFAQACLRLRSLVHSSSSYDRIETPHSLSPTHIPLTVV